MLDIRPAAVAGVFYPGDEKTLSGNVHAMLAGAQTCAFYPKALIVPHAGYVYSGAIAASGYAALENIAAHVRRVVLLGPTHRVAVRGMALPGAAAFSTPLGTVGIDVAAVQSISHLPQVVTSPRVHAQEHSIEVQLPFLQTVLTDFKLLPLAVGDATAQEVAEVLELLWGGDETLIVISSDLSHYLPYDQARNVDHSTAQAILGLQPDITHDRACGATPVNGLMIAARRHGLVPHLIDLRNSGDTAGPRDGVVGYASFAFYRGARAAMTADRGGVLLPIARAAISSALNLPRTADESAPWLAEPGACFVTLTQHDQLRGCIGSLQAQRPLLVDVKQNAVSAAFRDPRFVPLREEELDHTKIEISLLSVAEPMKFHDEADALAQLRPQVDGVIFEYAHNRSTFLPQVWEQLPQPREFLAHLKLKAGVAPDFWAEGVKLSRYSVEKWSE